MSYMVKFLQCCGLVTPGFNPFLEQFVLTIFRTADGAAGVFKYKVLPALTLQSLPPPLPPQRTLTQATYLHCTDLVVYSTAKQVTEL
jgi:hypothetical protein